MNIYMYNELWIYNCQLYSEKCFSIGYLLCNKKKRNDWIVIRLSNIFRLFFYLKMKKKKLSFIALVSYLHWNHAFEPESIGRKSSKAQIHAFVWPSHIQMATLVYVEQQRRGKLPHAAPASVATNTHIFHHKILIFILFVLSSTIF